MGSAGILTVGGGCGGDMWWCLISTLGTGWWGLLDGALVDTVTLALVYDGGVAVRAPVLGVAPFVAQELGRLLDSRPGL